MRLALLSPVHGQTIKHISRQLENYRVFLAPFRLRHYLHISLESSPELREDLIRFAEENNHDVVISEQSRTTWNTCTAHAFSELVKTALNDDVVHDKVLIHTDTDLLFSRKAAKHLKKHSIGSWDRKFRGPKGRWKWSQKVMQDPRIDHFVHEILDGDHTALCSGRVCGSFMPWSVFKPLGILFNHYFDNNYFDQYPKQRWPITEIAIPSILRLLQGPRTNFADILIKASEGKSDNPTRAIRRGLRDQDYFGLKIKKASGTSDEKAFNLISRLQNKAAKRI